MFILTGIFLNDCWIFTSFFNISDYSTRVYIVYACNGSMTNNICLILLNVIIYSDGVEVYETFKMMIYFILDIKNNCTNSQQIMEMGGYVLCVQLLVIISLIPWPLRTATPCPPTAKRIQWTKFHHTIFILTIIGFLCGNCAACIVVLLGVSFHWLMCWVHFYPDINKDLYQIVQK